MAVQEIYLSVIVPAYNEAERIGKTLARLHDYLSQSGLSWEILVVIDGSTDDTLEVARQQAQSIPGLRIIERAVNRGKGFTVKEGMLAAAGSARSLESGLNVVIYCLSTTLVVKSVYVACTTHRISGRGLPCYLSG